MRYYAVFPKFSRKDKKAGKEKELTAKITAMDRAILKKASPTRGEDIVGLVNACKPYTNRFGGKQFASSPEVRGAVHKLVRLGLLEER